MQIGKTIKQLRKNNELTQKELAMRAGVGLRFIRELEQGKETVRLDKVNQVLSMFGYTISTTKINQLNTLKNTKNETTKHITQNIQDITAQVRQFYKQYNINQNKDSNQ